MGSVEDGSFDVAIMGAVLLFFLFVICDKMEECCGKIIIKKGKKEDEE